MEARPSPSRLVTRPRGGPPAPARSPYYKDTHREYRARVRAFVEKEVTPFCAQWDEVKAIPRELFVKAYEARRAQTEPWIFQA